MFNIFNPPYVRTREPVRIPMFDYYIRQTLTECSKVNDFYRNYPYMGKSTDVWIKFLTTIETYIQSSPSELLRIIRDISPRLNTMFNFASPLTQSTINNIGCMYNRNTPDIFISVELDIDADKAAREYKSVTPIRVISHDFDNWSYAVCNGEYQADSGGVAIFTVDMGLLAIQYQQWCKHERVDKITKVAKQNAEFIGRYIWTSTLYSHIDNVIFNRLLNIVDGKSSGSYYNGHSFYLVDYGNHYDQQLSILVDKFKRRPLDWQSRLKSIPSIEFSNYYESVIYPDTAPTRQIRWVMVLSKLKMLEFLLKTDVYDQNSALAVGDRITIARELKTLINDRSLECLGGSKLMDRIRWIYAQVNTEQP